MLHSLIKAKSPSAWSALILICGIVFFRFVYPPINIISWDVFGYYLYLPAVFIFHDLRLHDIAWVHQLIEHYQTTSTLYQATALPSGGWVMKYSMGMAVLNAPAFFIAHLFSAISGFKTDGFSLPYQYAWAISGLVYTAIGIVLLRKILLQYFNEKTSSFLLIVFVLATNYFQLTAFDGYLSHNYLFALYTSIVWFTIRWHQQPKWQYALGLGLSMGLAVLVRPSELVCILIPLLWGIHNIDTIRLKVQLIRSNAFQILLILFSAGIAGMPQLLYWKYATGHWLFYSYNNAGEGFDFSQPYLKEVLFSFRKGWLVYTPVMLFAVAGFVSMFKANRSLFYCIFIYFLTNLYIVSSWTCWWYAGGSYSQRALLSSYVLLAFPMGYFMKEVFSWNTLLRSLVFLIIGFMLILNLFQTWQWAHGILDRTRMTRQYYFATFGKTTVTESDRKLLLIERSTDGEQLLKNEQDCTKRTAWNMDFENPAVSNLTLSKDTVFEGKYSLRMDAQHPFSPAFSLPFNQITAKDHAWLRAELQVFPAKEVEDNMASLVITFQHNGQPYCYQAASIALSKFEIKAGQWNPMRMDYLTPEVRSEKDSVNVYFWLQGKVPVYIDKFKIDVFD